MSFRGFFWIITLTIGVLVAAWAAGAVADGIFAANQAPFHAEAML
jgi:hypothetical protein